MIKLSFWGYILKTASRYLIYLMLGYMFLNLMCIGWDMEGTYYDDTEDVELYKDLNKIEEVYYLSENKMSPLEGQQNGR